MRVIPLILFAAFLTNGWTPDAQAISITERAGNPFRTAANNQEFTLNKGNVNPSKFGLLRTYNFMDKLLQEEQARRLKLSQQRKVVRIIQPKKVKIRRKESPYYLEKGRWKKKKRL